MKQVRWLLLLLLLSACASRRSLYNGTVDDVSCENISGWAMDWTRVSESLDVTIFDERGPFRVRISARLPRGDFPKGAQNHVFSIATPAALKDGKNHFLHFDFEDTLGELRNSPRPLNCAQ